MSDFRFIKQGYEILSDYGPWITQEIADTARVCYQSVPKGETEEEIVAANEALVRSLIKRGHTAMIEHGDNIKVMFRCSRSIANEIVRHRHFSFAQESTRWVNYLDKEIEYVLPDITNPFYLQGFQEVCEFNTRWYKALVEDGCPPEIARELLPHCLATTLVVSGNPRCWRNFFILRTAKNAHRFMRSLVIPLLKELRDGIPEVFEGIID